MIYQRVSKSTCHSSSNTKNEVAHTSSDRMYNVNAETFEDDTLTWPEERDIAPSSPLPCHFCCPYETPPLPPPLPPAISAAPKCASIAAGNNMSSINQSISPSSSLRAASQSASRSGNLWTTNQRYFSIKRSSIDSPQHTVICPYIRTVCILI